MPPISVMIKPVSGSCNMNCAYCFYCDEQKNRSRKNYGVMSEETLRCTIRKMILQAQGSCMIAFQGGEPSLAGLDFFRLAVEYAQYYNKNNVDVSFGFQTNGSLLTEEWCEFFRKNHFLVGVSLDGTRSLHDRYRRFTSGAPTWDRIVDTIRMLDRHQAEFNILTVVHRETASHIREIYHFYKKMHWEFQQYITCLDPIGEMPGQRSYSLTPRQYGQFLNDLFDCWYEDYLNGCQPYIRQFENYIESLLGYLPESCEQRGCCGIQYVAEADGSIYPCDFYMLDPYLLGNIHRDSISDMDARRKTIRFLERSQPLPPACAACPYAAVCRNGCMRTRRELSPGGYQTYFCEGYRMFFDHCLPRLKEIARSCLRP